MPTHLEVNGQTRETENDPAIPLAVYLREELELRGTKIGCGNGECGACTVVMDGRAVCSCLVPLGRTDGRRIETIESLGDLNNLHPIQRKLVERGAFQCGFCTPGIVMSLIALLRRNPTPDDAAIRTALQGNLCRCSGYVKLLEAIGEIVREGLHER
ncbi:MAG: (2Fe-2S)-binding protein [Rhodospirillaceae bacterium]|nr:(2Fe-2S)-binding protein [Rhodospirillaceae bacterium]MDD9913963.1 (2Fe-2S)-binding protein [Rhodospirillaceae bacterium]MDD9927920.1 (2Fe-2S)-binding protein [Rhodospirillaceae bacterium]